MTYVLNELSLNGQFASHLDFILNLKPLIQMLKIISDLRINVLKHPSLYQSHVTPASQLIDLLRDRSDEVVRFKSQLADLCSGGDFIDLDSRGIGNVYTLVDTGEDVSEASLSFGYDADSEIVSFLRSNFLNNIVGIQKDGVNNKELKNYCSPRELALYLFSSNSISPMTFCRNYFANTKINIEKIDTRFDFSTLDAGLIPQFINQLKLFETMSWSNILISDGLEYKTFNPPAFVVALPSGTNVYKFRINQKMRCFGYRKGDVFHVIGFEADHNLSDRG